MAPVPETAKQPVKKSEEHVQTEAAKKAEILCGLFEIKKDSYQAVLEFVQKQDPKTELQVLTNTFIDQVLPNLFKS